MRRLQLRQGGVLVLVVLAVTMSTVAVAVAAPEHAGNPSVTLDISPNDGDNLASIASLTATGAGFTAGGLGVSGVLLQCNSDFSICSDPIALFTSTAAGDFSETITVTNGFTGLDATNQFVPVNCLQVACKVRAESNSGSPFSAHHIAFAGATTNDPPTAVNDLYVTGENTALVVPTPGVLGNDTDPEGDALSAQVVASAAHGSMTLDANGSFNYIPNSNFNGTDSFTYQAIDASASSNTATVSITVTPVNDAPSFTKGPDQAVATNAGAQSVANWAGAISPGPTNEAGQTVSFMVTGNTNPGLFSAGPAVAPDGTLSYTPAANAVGTATMTVVAKDDGGTANGGIDTSLPQSFTITVIGVVTQATPTAALGQPISDTATVTGSSAGPTPTGTVVFTAYGPDDATCTGPAAFTSAVQTLGGDPATAASGPFTPTEIGEYRWIASYSGDANYPVVTTACNDPNETSTVTPPPTADFVTSFSPTNLRRDFSGWVGMRVQVGPDPLTVTEVGRWVVAGNTGTHAVMLVDAATGGSVVGGSAVVDTAGATPDSFAFADLPAPVVLAANTTYYVVSEEFVNGDYWYDYDTSIQTTAVGADTGAVWSSSAAPTSWNAGGSLGHGYVPTNFRYVTSAPPPPPPPPPGFVTSFAPTLARQDFSGWVGMRVQVGPDDLHVSGLGRWVVAGSTGIHTVKLVDAASGADVPGGSVVVDTAGAPPGSFAYLALPSTVTLAANTTYYLVSEEFVGGDVWYDYDTHVQTTAAGADTGAVYAFASSPTSWVVGGGVGDSFGPPSFLYTT